MELPYCQPMPDGCGLVSRVFAMKTTNGRVVRIAIFGGLALSLVFAVDALLLLSPTWNLLNPDYLSARETCRRWGERPLDVATFRASEEDKSTRAAMACSLLRTQDDYVGMNRREILALFGNPDGYYYTEMQPTYLVEVAKTESQDTWQIVFLIDRDRKVYEAVVHKNCC